MKRPSVDDLLSLTAQEIVHRLRDRGMTLQEIGDAIGVSRSFASRISSGEGEPTASIMVALQRLAVTKRIF